MSMHAIGIDFSDHPHISNPGVLSTLGPHGVAIGAARLASLAAA